MRDPFKITGPTCISFSGGRTSAYMLWRVLQSHGGKLPEECVVCFANTGKEDEATPRLERLRDEFSDEFFEYGDYGRIEIDSETLACRLVPRKEWRGRS